jgi:hypothetical protein
MVAGYEDVVYIIVVTELGVVVTKEFKIGSDVSIST